MKHNYFALTALGARSLHSASVITARSKEHKTNKSVF